MMNFTEAQEAAELWAHATARSANLPFRNPEWVQAQAKVALVWAQIAANALYFEIHLPLQVTDTASRSNDE